MRLASSDSPGPGPGTICVICRVEHGRDFKFHLALHETSYDNFPTGLAGELHWIHYLVCKKIICDEEALLRYNVRSPPLASVLNFLPVVHISEKKTTTLKYPGFCWLILDGQI